MFYIVVVGDVTERTFVEMLLAYIPKARLPFLMKFSTCLQERDIPERVTGSSAPCWKFLVRDHGKFYFNPERNPDADTVRCKKWLDEHLVMRSKSFNILRDLPPAKPSEPAVIHLDGDVTNNCLSNLAYA